MEMQHIPIFIASNHTQPVINLNNPLPLNRSTHQMLPQGSYVDIAWQAARSVGINPDLFIRQIRQESAFNSGAMSPAGVIGIAQFMPATAADMGVDPYNPVQPLYGAAHLMANLSAMYGGNYAMALAAYNSWPGIVQYAINMGGSNWRAYLPAETQNYIAVIMG